MKNKPVVCHITFHADNGVSHILMKLFLPYFAALVSCLSATFNVTSKQRIIKLESFGFTDNAEFRFRVVSASPTTLHMFMMPEKDAEKAMTEQSRIRATCYNNKRPIASINNTESTVSPLKEWNGTIQHGDVYVPIMIDCLHGKLSYSVTLTYTNENGLLDTREKIIPIVMLVCSIVHAGCALVWIINILMHRKFSIVLIYFIAGLPLIKAATSFVSTYEWRQKDLSDYVHPFWNRFVSILSMMYNIWALATITLAMSGFCIFRSSYEHHELFRILFSSLVLSAGIAWLSEAESGGVRTLAVLFFIFGFFWFIKANTIYMIAAVSILHSQISSQIANKVLLVKSFGSAFFTAVGITIAVKLLLLIIGASFTSRIVIYEIVLIAHEVLRMGFFMLRKKYEGDQFGQEKPHEQYKLRIITDPANMALVLMM